MEARQARHAYRRALHSRCSYLTACTAVHLHKRTPPVHSHGRMRGARTSCVIRGLYFLDRDSARRGRVSGAIIARRRDGHPLCGDEDHWVTLTVNVNAGNLDRAEWIVKSITRAVTARTNLSARATRVSCPRRSLVSSSICQPKNSPMRLNTYSAGYMRRLERYFRSFGSSGSEVRALENVQCSMKGVGNIFCHCGVFDTFAFSFLSRLHCTWKMMK